jgi:hypothetical protein
MVLIILVGEQHDAGGGALIGTPDDSLSDGGFGRIVGGGKESVDCRHCLFPSSSLLYLGISYFQRTPYIQQ